MASIPEQEVKVVVIGGGGVGRTKLIQRFITGEYLAELRVQLPHRNCIQIHIENQQMWTVNLC